jgi:tetratricopeptide (TPR) repeat protein
MFAVARPGRFSLFLVLALFALGCGARSKTPGGDTPLDGLRKAARKSPNDPVIWSELAIAEHLADGGDPEAARESLLHAKKLGAKGLRLLYVEAEEYVLEGKPQLAFDAYSELLRRAPDDSDPLAPLLAEISLSSLAEMNDAIDQYRPKLQTLHEALRPRAVALGLTGAHQLRMQMLGHALQRGDLKAAQTVASEAGCVQRAEVAGPFGPRELLGFDVSVPAEAPGPLAASYDLGAGRGQAATRKLETHRCLIGVGRGSHNAWPGTSVVRSELAVPVAGDYVLRLESPNSVIVWIDGQEIARFDLRKQPAFGVRYLPVTLAAGKHELKLKISSRHPNPVVALTLVPGDKNAVSDITLPDVTDSFTRYLAAKVALTRGNGVTAREFLRGAAQERPTAHWLVLSAAASVADPLRPAELRRDAARELLRRAGRQNPKAWYPSVGLANLEAAEGRTKEAIDGLRQAEAGWPDVIAIRTSLIEQLRERGYVEEADKRVAELERRMPDACAVAGIALGSARARGRLDQVAEISERVVACDATSSARFAVLKAQRRYDDAARELVRLEQLADPLDDAQRIESDIERAQIMGDTARVRALREARSQLWADRPAPVLDRADMFLASGEQKPAVDYLASALSKHPSELYDVRRVHEALGGDSLFKDFRKNGAQVISEFEKSGKSYQEPQVLLLDYTVVRLFEDGSSVDLTHNIMRVQSQEAVDENGEFSIPDGARLLTLHTVKADGTRLEPDAIAGKTSLSLPNLAPNDYVEFEMVRGEAPSLGFPGGYLGNRFYFKSFEVPFDHTELVVVMPASMQPVIDPRGPAPVTQQETKDGLRILRWSARESRPLSPEPLSVASREFLPSINLGVKVTWEAYVESLRDLLSDKDVVDPAAKQALQGILAGEGGEQGDVTEAPASVKAARIYRWVTDQIEPTDDVFGLAPAMLAARTGHRERILKYLLGLAEIPSELVLVRGVEADHSQALLPDLETYGYMLLRVQTEKGPLWLHAGARHAAAGYLPPQVRNEIGLVLNERAERVNTPNPAITEDLRTVEFEVQLQKGGGALIHARETLRGQGAVGWRNDLDEIPSAELEARFEEGYASNIVPGARLKELKIEAREAPDQPLVLDYKIEVDSIGQRSDHEQRIPALLPNQLAAQFARQGSRTTAQLIAPPQAIDIKVRVVLPDGVTVASAPRGVELQNPIGATFSSTTKVDGQNVDLTRTLRMPLGRVAPQAYPEFAGFCRNVDLAESSELVVKLP